MRYGKDEELVPEDVATIGLAVKAPGRNADVEIEGIARGGLEQMEDVEVQGQLRFAVVGLDLEGEPLPQVVPLANVVVEERR